MKYLLLLCVLPFLSLAQVQIGTNINGESAGDQSGFSVSLSSDGGIVAIGSHRNSGAGFLAGYVRVYRNDFGTWTQIGNDITGEAAQEQSGWNVSLSENGSVVAIGAIGSNENGISSGHVKVYRNVADTWSQVGGTIRGESPFDRSGFSVSLSADGGIVAIGSPNHNGVGTNSGHVRIYQDIANTWTQVGNTIEGYAAQDLSGGSVTLSFDGSLVSIGATGNEADTGHVRVYKNIDGTWTKEGADIDGDAVDDLSGISESLSAIGNVVAIGAPNNNENGINTGHVKVFRNISGTWTQIGEDIEGENSEDLSGGSLSLSSDGSMVAVGATGNDDNGNNAGQVRLYQNIQGNWTQVGVDINGVSTQDYSGLGISLSSDGNVVAIGARGNNSSTGHVKIYDISAVLSNESFIGTKLVVYPNPSESFVNVQLNEGLRLKKVNVYSVSGQLIKTENKHDISVSELAKGSYFLEIITDQGKATKKILVK